MKDPAEGVRSRKVLEVKGPVAGLRSRKAAETMEDPTEAMKSAEAAETMEDLAEESRPRKVLEMKDPAEVMRSTEAAETMKDPVEGMRSRSRDVPGTMEDPDHPTEGMRSRKAAETMRDLVEGEAVSETDDVWREGSPAKGYAYGKHAVPKAHDGFRYGYAVPGKKEGLAWEPWDHAVHGADRNARSDNSAPGPKVELRSGPVGHEGWG